MSKSVTPFSLKDASALMEKLLPVQKLSAEAYKEQMAVSGKTLTSLGSYWKGRKPLILAKACVLGCLLPATDYPSRDLEIFEKLMGMDDESFIFRLRNRPKPKEILSVLKIPRIADFFTINPPDSLPLSSPVDWSKPEYGSVSVIWREDVSETKRRDIEAQMLSIASYSEKVNQAKRPEEVNDVVYDHIWESVNDHLGTNAHSFPGLVEQLGIMRYGRRPQIADTFCGSGQIPFEAARLGCDVYASDLNPVACLLTWGAFNVVGARPDCLREFTLEKEAISEKILADVEKLGLETDEKGRRAKVYLYCLETRCPQTGWMVPMLPSRVVSVSERAIASLIPEPESKSYVIKILSGVSNQELEEAKSGTLRSDGRGQEPYLVHTLNGVQYRNKVSTLRGDYRKEDGTTGNKLRMWEKTDFEPRPDDIFQERLYCIQWIKPKSNEQGSVSNFCSITKEDLERERKVASIIAENITDWQAQGLLPDMRIEPGEKTNEPIRTRGWTYWHHLWSPRQLLSLALIKKQISSENLAVIFASILDYSSKLGLWYTTGAANRNVGERKRNGGAINSTVHVFYNQALNTLYNYGVRSTYDLIPILNKTIKNYPITSKTSVDCTSATELSTRNDIYISDPPYGDAVKYEEILEFFIAWLRKNPPKDFSKWIWDSRRSLAIKGEGEDFRRSMVTAYKQMTEHMSEGGLQVIMFTHQNSAIWADMANIVWASGLHVTAAWYVVTETDSGFREGSYVKGTVLLVCRKRSGLLKTTRDDLAWEIQEEVEAQVHSLVGLNQNAKALYRDENVFEDADIQMAGYAAALRVLTRYAIIDGRNMTLEAIRPRVKGEITFVDDLIVFAVNTANRCLVPQGIEKNTWNKLTGVERFYLKMIDLESHCSKKLDNYQNFAKVFKVGDFYPLMASKKANNARLKSAVEFSHLEMSETSELHDTILRAILYAIMELTAKVDGTEVLTHLSFNIPNYFSDMTQRETAVDLAEFFSRRLESIRPEEACTARVLSELIKNQRLG